MRAMFIRAGGIAALLVPVALWGGGLLAVTSVSGMQLPAAAGGVFEAAPGAVAPLLIAGALAAPSWAVLAIEIREAGDTTARFARDLAAPLGLLFGTLLALPIACLCHGIALLRAARRAEGAGHTSAA